LKFNLENCYFFLDNIDPRSWNTANGCCLGGDGSKIDEIAFFRKLIDIIETDLAPEEGFILDKT